ncbi:MAG: endo-1,3-alpha-glucanase family glycosylhydrolase [Chloroflexota bacterium]
MKNHHSRIGISLIVVIFLLFFSNFQNQAEPTEAQGRSGLVVAHYYAWFDPSSFNGGKTPFTNPSPYFSTDQNIMRQHIQQAQSVGIDGFIQAWYGPEPSQQTEPNMAALLNIANESGFKAAVSFEAVSGFMPDNNARISGLQTLLSTHAAHPAYLRIDGRPVVFFWANWALSVDEWAAIRNAADPGRSAIWIAEGGNYDYLSVFDGMYLYNIAWSDNPAGINIGQGSNTRAASGTYGAYKYWVGTAMPGFNDSLLGRGGNTIVRDRAGGNFYRSSFSGAVQSGPDLIAITSFNEWPEGSHIEPSSEFGDFYLSLTQELIGTYKGGGVPSSAPVAPAPTASPAAPANDSGSEPAAQPTAVAAAGTGGISGAPLPTPRSDGKIVYQVQPGDTLIVIAVRFDVLLEEIYQLNPTITNETLLTVGQEIVLGENAEIVEATAAADSLAAPTETPTPSIIDGFPGAEFNTEESSIVYAVQEGDTLIGIALRYGLQIEDLYSLNNLSAESLLSVGQALIVGYVPTPSAELRGGSADLPITPDAQEEATEPAEASTQIADPSPTPTPADANQLEGFAEQGELEDAAILTEAEGLTDSTPAITVESEEEIANVNVVENIQGIPVETREVASGNSAALSMTFWVLVSATVTLLLMTLGLFAIYLSRRSE